MLVFESSFAELLDAAEAAERLSESHMAPAFSSLKSGDGSTGFV